MINAERARELFVYDPDTGDLRWINNGRYVRAGSVAGYIMPDGYRRIYIEGRNYSSHRVVWLMAHGDWPACQIDHINGIRDDNRLSNLREATHTENMRNRRRPRNNTSGAKGVDWQSNCGLWRARIKAGDRRIFLGLFKTKEEAERAYAAASKEAHGEFARAA